ncbi:nuclear transport factor 2 family protein [Flavobacteriaceae bacterium TK19130]|nr:nuclear transport factor 2 family protein [Thermobacterium salinum]
MKKILPLLFLLCITFTFGQSKLEEDNKAILAVMKAQEKAWSQHDLEGFMQGYWKSDSLKFYGKSGLTKGWQQTLDNYKKGYPTADDSGTLTFTINDISPISEESYWVMGEYHLKRTVGDANGVFMIIFKKIDGEWKIVADMSCG